MEEYNIYIYKKKILHNNKQYSKIDVTKRITIFSSKFNILIELVRHVDHLGLRSPSWGLKYFDLLGFLITYRPMFVSPRNIRGV